MIVGTEVVKFDKPSFPWIYERHLVNLLPLVDRLYVRVDDPVDAVTPFLTDPKIEWEPQLPTERFEEDRERQALLGWALGTGAEWCASFDADEVLEPGGAEIVRRWLEGNPRDTRSIGFNMNYSSHHRPGYVLPRAGVSPRLFRLDARARAHKYRADEDGLHCGTVPPGGPRCRSLDEVVLIHYHATTCEEYMGERAFYDGTGEVRRHGGIDYLYRCDRFGCERDAFPEETLYRGREERWQRLVAQS